MQVSDSQANLKRVELYYRLWKSLVCLKNFVELATAHERHHKIEACLTLEEVVHPAEEWVITAEQDIFFQARVLHLLEVEKNIFSDRLDRVLFTRIVTAELRKEDFAKRTFTEQRFFVKVF